MPTFGLIAEGKTDFTVLENILSGFMGRDMSAEITHLQPNPAAADASAFGNWYKVFEYCKSSDFAQAFGQNDYVVVHVDTDRAGDTNYDITITREMSVADITAKVREKIRGFIQTDLPAETWAYIQDKIIFAVAVHSTECWLLPIHISEAKKAEKILGCLETLQREGVNLDKSNQRTYDDASKEFRKRKNLEKLAPKHESLRLLWEELTTKVKPETSEAA